MPSRWCQLCHRVIAASDYAAHQQQHRPRKTPAGWQQLRLRILDRDHHRCQVCGSTEKLEVHHLDSNWRNNTLTNLETRCHAHNPRGSLPQYVG